MLADRRLSLVATLLLSAAPVAASATTPVPRVHACGTMQWLPNASERYLEDARPTALIAGLSLPLTTGGR